jgi:type IV pilus assembly protein PilO
MGRNFNFRPGLNVKDPRIVMRVLIGVLLAANLAAAVVAFKPFGGSADDLRREQQMLTAQLTRAQQQLANSKRLVDKVEQARTEGDKFLDQYFTDGQTTAALILTELNSTARDAGIKMGQAQFNRENIEGSDTLQMLTTNVGFEGNYTNLTKFVNLLDKSARFMIIESMQAAAPQQQAGQSLNVSLKIDTFVKDAPGATP